MARPVKKGLEYFSHDVTMSDDKKIKLLEKKCGYVGYAVYLKLLEELYKNDGYFLEIDEEELECVFNLIEIEEVFEIIKVCIQRGLFDEEKFDKYNILTSERIQKNYLAGTGRRNSVKMKKEYVIVDQMYTETTSKDSNNGVNVYNNLVNVDNNSINVDAGTQSKVKKRKEKESKEKQTKNNVDVDVVFEAALKIAKEKGVKNPEAYARRMIENGFTTKTENESTFKFSQTSYEKLLKQEAENNLTDRQRGRLEKMKEWVKNNKGE